MKEEWKGSETFNESKSHKNMRRKDYIDQKKKGAI